MGLEGQIAVVTGGASGLGKAAAERLRADGAIVEIFDLTNGVDVADELQVHDAVSGVIERHRRLDILINNAGIYPHTMFEDLRFDDWRRILRINLDSVFLCCSAAYPFMRKQTYGRIINISSSTVFIGYPGLSAYTASKSGIIGFTRALASEAGPFGITVNAITPGMIATEQAMREEGAIFAEILEGQAVKRLGDVKDVSACIGYLVSPEASWITGQTLNVDGGHRYH